MKWRNHRKCRWFPHLKNNRQGLKMVGEQSARRLVCIMGVCVCDHILIYVYIDTQATTYTLTNYTQTYAYMLYTYIRICAYKRTHACHTWIRVYIIMHTCIHTYVHRYTHMNSIHTHSIHGYLCIHTYVHR